MTQVNKLSKNAKSEEFITSRKSNVTFYDPSSEDLKGKHAKLTTENTRLIGLFGSRDAQVVDFQNILTANDAVVGCTVQTFCLTLRSFFDSLVENYRISASRSVAEACRSGSIDSHIYAYADG